MRSTLGLVALAACGGGDGGKDGGTGGGPTGDVELTVTATVVDEMPTVVRVQVTSDADVPVHVAFGEGDAFDRTTADDGGGTEHEALLVGLPQGTAIRLRAEAGASTSDPVEVTTGTLDAPAPTVDGDGPGTWVALPVLSDTETWAELLDPEGRVVWAWRDRSGLATFRVRVAADGSGLVYNRADAGPNPEAALVWVTWDGVETVVPTPDLAHDFVDHADGSVVALGYEERAGVLGNTLMTVARDGTDTPFWTTWDCLDPVGNAGDDPAHGWTHANALDEDGDGWLVGLRNLSTIVRVDADGSCPWALGGTGGTLAVTGPAFQHEHQFQRDGDRMLVFDNDGAAGNQSRVLEYSLDLAGGTATNTGTIVGDPPEYCFILGDVHRFDDGDTLVAWSTAPRLDRTDAGGALVGRVSFSGQGRVGFLDLHDSL